MNQIVSDAPKIGDNNPPASEVMVEALHKRLIEDYKAIADTTERLATRANEAPKSIADDDQQAVVSQLMRDVAESAKNIEGQRVAEKAPYLAAERLVDGFFKEFTTRLDTITRAMSKRLKDYLDAKAAAERRAREEEARLAREAEQRRLAEAQAAQEAANQAAQEQRTLEAAQSQQAANVAFDQAVQLEGRARDAELEAKAKPAELARTRTSTGVLSTLRTEWKGEITELDKVDLEALRPFLKRDDIQKAVNQFVRIHKGTKELKGVRIFEDTAAVVR